MNLCVMPAPAPWAKTKQARACGGSLNRAETVVDGPTAIVSSRGVTLFIPRASPARKDRATAPPSGTAVDLAARQRDRALINRRAVPGFNGREVRLARLIA